MTRSRIRQAGFTMIEVMVAVMLTAIAVIGVVGIYRVQTRSADYSRRSTEAAVLAGDKLEALHTVAVPVALPLPGETIDATGAPSASGPFRRSWTVATSPAAPATPTQYDLTVQVQWVEEGATTAAITRTVTLRAFRKI